MEVRCICYIRMRCVSNDTVLRFRVAKSFETAWMDLIFLVSLCGFRSSIKLMFKIHKSGFTRHVISRCTPIKIQRNSVSAVYIFACPLYSVIFRQKTNSYWSKFGHNSQIGTLDTWREDKLQMNSKKIRYICWKGASLHSQKTTLLPNAGWSWSEYGDVWNVLAGLSLNKNPPKNLVGGFKPSRPNNVFSSNFPEAGRTWNHVFLATRKVTRPEW